MRAPRIRSTGVVGALVATLLVAGVVVAAAHGGGPTEKVIHACVDDRTGAVEIVHANAGCGQDAHPLDWNAEGPRGPRGRQGPPGVSGGTLELDLEVITRSATFDARSDQANGSVTGSGVGVDCPGDAIATGGGGSAYENFGGSPAGPVFTTSPVPLVATYALEHNSSEDPADPGDVPTGWWAAARSGSAGTVTAGSSGAALVSPTIVVTVWAVCSSGPPEDS